MATHVIETQFVGIDAGVSLDKVKNQITAAAAPSIGEIDCYVLADGGSDEGVYVRFRVPKNYVGTPKLSVVGYLDGAPGASDTLGFTFRKRASAKNEAGDGAFDAEQTVSETIGSSGLAYSDEDLYQGEITLTGADYAVDDEVSGYLAIDASGTTYAGNFLLVAAHFVFNDA